VKVEWKREQLGKVVVESPRREVSERNLRSWSRSSRSYELPLLGATIVPRKKMPIRRRVGPADDRLREDHEVDGE
jgi:hypothetical protein